MSGGDGWRLAPATPDDAGALATILSDWIDGTEWMPRLHSRGDDLAFVCGLVRQGCVTVACRGGQVAGFLALRGDEIAALYVAGDARGQGGGGRLIEDAKAGTERLALWTFRANAGAVAFYERHGFRAVGGTEGDNEEGLPDVRMVWERDSDGGA